MMVSFVLSFFPRDVLDEILNLIESVSEDFPSYSSLVYRSFELVNTRFKQANKSNMLYCIFRRPRKLIPINRLLNCFFLKITVKNSKILELQKKNTGGHLRIFSLILHIQKLN